MFQAIIRHIPAFVLAGFLPLAPAQAAELLQGKWQLESLNGAPAASEVKTTLELGTDGNIHGSGGCNRYTGKAEITDRSITFSPLAATRMACQPVAMEQEQKFFTAMATVKNWQIEDGKLALRNADGDPTLLFAPVSSGISISIDIPGAGSVDRAKMSYLCGRLPVEAEYINAGTNALALLSIGGESVIAANVIAASGAKYAGKQFIWWTQGDEASLYDLTKGENAKPVSCRKVDENP